MGEMGEKVNTSFRQQGKENFYFCDGKLCRSIKRNKKRRWRELAKD